MQTRRVIINPTETAYPGGRGSDQLVVYTRDYGKPTTGTNPYGTEFVVAGGIVTEFGSNNSRIPEDGFVVSGHGEAQNWLQENLWYGSRVYLENDEIKVLTDETTERDGARILAEKMAEEGILSSPSAAPTTRSEIEDLYLKSLPSRTVEVRGIWHEQTEKTPDEIRKTVKRLQDSGFNLLLLEVYYHGYTIYPSKFATQMPQYEGWDPLAVWQEECNKAGIEIHPWVHCFFAGFGEKGSVADLHPEWLGKRRDGKLQSNVERGFYWLEPALDEVQDFLISLFKELLHTYGFSALHLDYIRYGETACFNEAFSFSDSAVKVFKEKTGLDALELTKDSQEWALWLKFREDNITRFVRRARKEFPGVLLSTAIFPELEHARASKGQNWALWLEEGLLDYLAPMIYSTDTEYVVKMTEFAKDLNPQIPVYTGLGPFMGFSPLELARQIYAVSKAAPGTVLFALHSVKDRHMEALKKGIFKAKAVLPWQK